MQESDSAYRKICQAHISILSWVEAVHSLVIGQEQSLWCTGGLASHRGKDVDMSLTILCPSTRVPSPPSSSCLCPKSKSSLAKWQRRTGRKSGLSEMVSVMSGQYVSQGERKRGPGTTLFESFILCHRVDQMDKGDGLKVWPDTPVISSLLASLEIWRQCSHCTSESSALRTLFSRLKQSMTCCFSCSLVPSGRLKTQTS